MASASEDNTVVLYDVNKSDGKYKFDGLATRFSLPARHVCFNATGSHVAAAGDEPDVKVVCLLDKSAKVLRGHEGAIRSLTFDPEGELLASASTDGTLRIWQLKDSSCTKTLQVLIEREDSQLKIDWHPNGKFIAVPVGQRTTVYERDTWEVAFSFGGEEGHSRAVALAAWSPNGEYLASVSIGGEIIVWETQTKQSLGRFKHKEGLPISSIAWDPSGNALLWGDAFGKVAVWKEPVPAASQFAAPTGGDAVAAVESQAQDLSNLFDDDDEEDIGKRKRLKKKKTVAKDDSDDEDDADAAAKKLAGSPASKKSKKEKSPEDEESEYEYETVPIPQVELQHPFQPASTPLDESRRILVWNNVGVITSREDDVTCSVDVEFHNVQKHKPIRMVDHFGFTMGALGERAFVMAAPSHSPQSATDERDHPSVLFCRNVDHWATDETWQVFFPEGEEVEAIAVGSGTSAVIAAATNKRYLRLYSTTGLVRHVMSLDGPIVSMACYNEMLMAVYHFGLGTNGDQSMSCALIDTEARRVRHKDRLPLKAGALLNWVGFSDDGLPAMVDSTETVSVLLQDWDFTWTPIAELKEAAKNKGDKHWVVGLSEHEIMCVVCKGGSSYPKVLPRPMISTLEQSMPIVGMKESQAMEEKYLRSKINYQHIKRIEDLDEADPDDNALMLHSQGTIDKHVLHCISRAVQSQKAGRALDLTTNLSLAKSIDTAIKLAVKAKLPMLAERMSLAKLAHVEKKQNEREEDAEARADRAMALANTPNTPSYAQLSRRAPAQNQMAFTPSVPFTPVDRGHGGGGAAKLQQMRPGARRQATKPADVKEELEEAEAPAVDEQQDEDEDEQAGMKSSSTTNTTSSSPFVKNPFASAKKNPFGKAAPSKLAAGSFKSTSTESKSPGKAGMMMLKQASSKTKGTMGDSQAAPAPKKAKKDPNAPKKPLSSYMQWLQKERPQLKKDFPDSKNTEVLKHAGERWGKMEEGPKKEWTDKYEADIAEWKSECAKYEAAKSEPAAAAAAAEEVAEPEPMDVPMGAQAVAVA
jgi:chromosome transmission fidelity protein 4